MSKKNNKFNLFPLFVAFFLGLATFAPKGYSNEVPTASQCQVQPIGQKRNLFKAQALLPLSASYEIEKMPIQIGSIKYHLYPTPKVSQLYNHYLSLSDNFKNFENFLQDIPHSLEVSKDTTVYLPHDWVYNNKLAIYKNGFLFRENGRALIPEGEYIYVMDANGELLITTKRRDSKDGRIHHSSLVAADQVYAAGTLLIKRNMTGGAYHYFFRNESGHYQPANGNLDLIFTWLKSQGARYEILNEKINHLNQREIELSFFKN